MDIMEFGGHKVNKLFVTILILILFCNSFSVYAIFGYSDAEQYQNSLTENPSNSFATDSAKTWETIESNPELMNDPKVAAEAFKNNPARASEFLNRNPDFFSKPHIVKNFETAIKKDIGLLNKNTNAKENWLKQKYNIKMTDKNTEIKKFDGMYLSTGGSGATTFAINDLPNAIVFKDGSISLRGALYSGGRIWSSQHDQVKYPKYEVDGGTFTGKLKEGFLEVNGKNFNVIDLDGVTTVFKGKGHYESSDNGEKFTGIFVRDKNTIVEGSLFKKKGSRDTDYVFVGDTKVTKKDKTVITLGKTKNGKEGVDRVVYYSEEKDPDKHCNSADKKYTCVSNVGSRSSQGKYRERLGVKDVKDQVKVEVKTPVFYSNVDVENIEDGEVTVESTKEIIKKKKGVRVVTEKTISKITITSPTEDEKKKGKTVDIKVKGKLSGTNAGRLDIVSNKNPECEGENCLQELKHWSSNNLQKDTKYFSNRNRNKFATCDIGVNCEKEFAKTFGKIVGPRGKEPQMTIIVAGDNANTAKSLERSQCKIIGCYILNSRDIPSTTKSETLVVGGHHWSDSRGHESDRYVWRDAVDKEKHINGWKDPHTGKVHESFKEGRIPTYNDHNPIDKIYLDGKADSGSKFASLPTGNVKHIEFSACNTGRSDETPLAKTISKKYKTLKSVKGWNGKAPLYDNLKKVSAIGEQINFQKRKEAKGSASLVMKDQSGNWVYTSDGITCQRFFDKAQNGKWIDNSVSCSSIAMAGGGLIAS